MGRKRRPNLDELGEKLKEDFMHRFQAQLLKRMIEDGLIKQTKDGKLAIKNLDGVDE